MQLQPQHILLHVADLAASTDFYRSLLGIEPVEPGETFVLFALPSGLKLGLWARDDVEPAPGPAGSGVEIGFRVDSRAAVEDTFAAWQAQGVAIQHSPARVRFGYSFLALDPDGHWLRVYALGQE
ncbi:MAG TPA: VOC family protein [Pedomonas sp.]|uniref:VOC family protein n=1 Tax=Pedomonas sp. TaxID=2976421 RepID=UPI002F3FB51D